MKERCIPRSVLLSVLLLVGVSASSLSARPMTEQPRRLLMQPPSTPRAEGAGERTDTTFVFAATGPGSFGSPGTNMRGFHFDGEGGAPEPAGWFPVDLTAQTGEYWHVASTDICAGTGTDMSQALPFDAGDTVNDYALWCGVEDPCLLVSTPGYGNDWDQYLDIDIADIYFGTDLELRFAYRADFEGDPWDFFEVLLEVDGEFEPIYHNGISSEQTFLELDLEILAEAYPPGTEFTMLRFRFVSDGAWSDEDGLYASNVGAVWVDNLRILADGGEVLAGDFEDGLAPDWIAFTTPPGAGSNAALHSNLFQEDICVVNNSNAWAFWAVGHYTPGYPTPVVPYGPPYIHDSIQSPLLEVDAQGQPITIGPETQVGLRYHRYADMPLNSLIFLEGPHIAAWVEENDCLMPFQHNTTIYFYDELGWTMCDRIMNFELEASAAGGTVTGIALRFAVIDACPFWCNINGDGTNHSPAPYIDNISLYLVDRSDAEWLVDGFTQLQDNFPEVNGKVRIDGAMDIAGVEDPFIQPADTCVVVLNMDPLGGIAESVNPISGELLPDLYLCYRVITGPHEAIIEQAQADPDASDGSWSPYIGSFEFAGSTWGMIQAATTAVEDRYAFDFNDDYFMSGDVIEYFYRAEAVSGAESYRPAWAMSGNPDLRSYYYLRCLPTPGINLLFVDDHNRREPGESECVGDVWAEAFAYNGYFDLDIYAVQAYGYCDNGLGGRAEPGQLEQYDIIVWDSGDLPSYTITYGGSYQKSDDAALLQDWLASTPRRVGLWVMGNVIAMDLANSPFLATTLGAYLHSTDLFYDDLTGIYSSLVYVTHPDFGYEGEVPYFLVDGGCPNFENFALVSPTASAMTETALEWEDDGGINLVAGILNRDPDGNGTTVNEAGEISRCLFNPFSYSHVRDAGFAIGGGIDYARVFVGHALERLLGAEPIGPGVAVDDSSPPARTELRGAWPNPFNPSTTIAFSLAEGGQARLRIFDVSGRLVRVLQDGRLAAGEHEFIWDGRSDRGAVQSSGVYFAAFRAGEVETQEKIVLLK